MKLFSLALFVAFAYAEGDADKTTDDTATENSQAGNPIQTSADITFVAPKYERHNGNEDEWSELTASYKYSVVEDGSVTTHTMMSVTDKTGRTWNNDWYVQWRIGMKDPASKDNLTKWEFAYATLRNKAGSTSQLTQKVLEQAETNWTPDIKNKNTDNFNNKVVNEATLDAWALAEGTADMPAIGFSTDKKKTWGNFDRLPGKNELFTIAKDGSDVSGFLGFAGLNNDNNYNWSRTWKDCVWKTAEIITWEKKPEEKAEEKAAASALVSGAAAILALASLNM